MNFTRELSQFQGALLSADNTHSFSQLSAKGGNEDEISDVVENLINFLELNGYIKNHILNKEKYVTLRQFAFYIILNSNLPVLDEFLELDGIDSIIWTINTVPQCLMCELLWGLEMKPFVHEIISYSYPQLALQVLGAFIDNFKYFQPQNCLDNLRTLSKSCYKTITRLHLLNEPDVTSKATAGLNYFKKCLKYFSEPPNAHKLNQMGQDELYEFMGTRLEVMLLLILDCIEYYSNKLEKDALGSEIYLLTYKEGTMKTDVADSKVCVLNHNVLSECLNLCNTNMLDECKTLVMDVSLDVFCRWSEIDDCGQSMQKTIGELCYKVSNIVKDINTLAEHPIHDMIKQISRKPDEMQDIINSTDDKVILEKINTETEDRKVWIQSLIYKEKLCHNLEFLNAVSANLNLFDQEQSHKLYTVLKDYVNEKLDNQESAESLMVKAFHQCNLQTKYIILDDHFINNNYRNMKATPDFNNSITETFNKFIATPESDLSDVLTLFLQNPQEVYTKTFLLATENIHQAEVMIKVMKMFKKYSNYYYNSEMEPCIITITQEVIHKKLDSTAKENNFIKFISGLKDLDIIPGSKLLLLIIMSNLHQGLITRSIESICFHLKLLKDAYSLEELLQYRAPMLAMLGKVMDVVRWKINTFTANCPSALTLAIDLQQSIFGTYSNEIPEREEDWLKVKLGNLKPLNMFYYKALWAPKTNYLNDISGLDDKNRTADEISSWMCQVIASCTQPEWCELWDNIHRGDEMKLDAFVIALGVISMTERAHRTEHSLACVIYCYKNLVYIMRYKYFKEPLTENQVKCVIKYLAAAVELASDDLHGDLSNLILPLFAFLSEKETEYGLNYSDHINENWQNSKLARIVNKMFRNGTA